MPRKVNIFFDLFISLLGLLLAKLFRRFTLLRLLWLEQRTTTTGFALWGAFCPGVWVATAILSIRYALA